MEIFEYDELWSNDAGVSRNIENQDANFVRSQWSPNLVFAIARAMSGNQQRKKQESFEQHRSGDARLGLSGRQRLGMRTRYVLVSDGDINDSMASGYTNFMY